MATNNHYKVVWGSRKVGVVASNFCEFIAKCKERFNLKDGCSLIVSLEDQTEVDEEFFSLVKWGETLILSIPNTSSDVPQDEPSLLPSSLQDNLFWELQKFLHECLKAQPNLSSHLQDLLACDNLEVFQERIAALPVCSEKAISSSREDHPDWFKGLSSGQHSKEQVLRGSAECRMRGYLHHLQRDLRSQLKTDQGDEDCRADHDPGREEDSGSDQDTTDGGTSNKHQLHKTVEEIISYFKNQLKMNRFNQSYFDRTAPTPQSRLCNPSGRFCCGGPYNRPRCCALHSINPYASREQRIIFSTWNLDHMIEKSRSVIPTLKKLICTQPVSAINQPYFYDLLFTKHDGIDHSCYKNNINYNEEKKCLASSHLKFHSNLLTSGLGDPYMLKDGMDGDGTDLSGRFAGSGSLSGRCKAAVDENDGNVCRKKQKREGYGPSVMLASPSVSSSIPVTPICSGSSIHVSNSHGTSKLKLSPSSLTSQTPVLAKITKNTCNSESKDGEKLKVNTHFNVISSSCKVVPSIASLQSRDSKTSYQVLEGQISDVSRSNSRVVGSLKQQSKQCSWDGNLKLVHIACHVKLPHDDMKCNPAYILLPTEDMKLETKHTEQNGLGVALDRHQKKVIGRNQRPQSSSLTAVSRKERSDGTVKEVRKLRNRQKRNTQRDECESNFDLHDGMTAPSIPGTKELRAYVSLSHSVDIDHLVKKELSSGCASSVGGRSSGTYRSYNLSQASSTQKKPGRCISNPASVGDCHRSSVCSGETSSCVSSKRLRRSKRQSFTSNSKSKRARR